MLKIGSDTLSEGRKVVTHLTNAEVYKKIENDFKKEFQSLDNEIELEKLTSLKMQEKIAQMYETQIEQLNKKLDNAMGQIKTYEKDMSASLQEEVNKVKEKYDTQISQRVNSNYTLFDNWWSDNVEIDSEGKMISSTDLWRRFKKDNKPLINHMNINSNNFKQYLNSKVPISSIFLRSIKANSAFDIHGIKLKE
jgi:23S rRNA pseudoU1915 N3-methylase RlmH